MMLIPANRLLKRHGLKVLGAAMLAMAILSLFAKTSPDGSQQSHADGESVVAICATFTACVAIIGVSVFAIRRLVRRPLWWIRDPLTPATAFVPASLGFPIRAGPPSPSLLQTFRL